MTIKTEIESALEIVESTVKELRYGSAQDHMYCTDLKAVQKHLEEVLDMIEEREEQIALAARTLGRT